MFILILYFVYDVDSNNNSRWNFFPRYHRTRDTSGGNFTPLDFRRCKKPGHLRVKGLGLRVGVKVKG